MDIKSLAELFLAGLDKVGFYWNFYVIMMLALCGWIASTDRLFKKDLKILLSVGYLFFVTMNVIGLWIAYTVTEALRLDLLDAAMANSTHLKNTIKVLTAHSFSTRSYSSLFIHIVLAIAVLILIWRQPEKKT